MNWFQKISQNISDSLSKEYSILEMQVYQEKSQLRNILYKQLPKAQNYVDSMRQEHDIKSEEHKLNQKLIQWIQQHMNEITNSGNPKLQQIFQEELTRLQQLPVFDESEYQDYFDKEVLEWYLDNGTEQQISEILHKNNIPFGTVEFPTGIKVVVIEFSEDPSEWFILKKDTNGIDWAEDANDWVRNAVDHSYLYIPEKSGDDFWKEVTPGTVVYHATPTENVESILSNGLWMENKTRGLSNRSTYDAVFSSWNSDAIESYGDAVFEINLGQMKQDGFMPRVEQEEPVSEAEIEETIANLLGIDDYHTDVESGIDPETVVIYSNIPPKYLQLI